MFRPHPGHHHLHPCVLAERVAAYAKDNASTFSSVVIEALDFFLRGQKPA